LIIRYRRPVGDTNEILLEPNNDENYEIHNDRFTLLRPNSQWTGDYICRAILDVDKYSSSLTEFATIQVRTQPYIEDFGSDTSHTGKSSVVTDGERLELTCSVRDTVTPVNITWLRSVNPDDERTMVVLPDTPKSAMISSNDNADTFMVSDQNIIVEPVTNHSKRLIIESVKHEHRSYYVCLVDNGVTERARKVIFVRVKDRLVALWPFLGIVAELFILFTIIHVWETQRAYKEIHATPQNPPITTGNKRPASGASVAFESVPLTNG